MAIPFKNDKCTGWVIFAPEYIDGENINNHHVSEAEVWRDKEGKLQYYRPANTICGKATKSEVRGIVYDNEDAVRNQLTEFQNSGNHEICGNCAKHFFKDDPTEGQQ